MVFAAITLGNLSSLSKDMLSQRQRQSKNAPERKSSSNNIQNATSLAANLERSCLQFDRHVRSSCRSQKDLTEGHSSTSRWLAQTDHGSRRNHLGVTRNMKFHTMQQSTIQFNDTIHPDFYTKDTRSSARIHSCLLKDSATSHPMPLACIDIGIVISVCMHTQPFVRLHLSITNDRR